MGKNNSFKNFGSGLACGIFKCVVCGWAFARSLSIKHNGLRLGEGGDLTTNVHTKHTLQIYEKLSYEALNRHFCQTAVSGWASLFSVCQQHFLSC